MKLYFTSCVLTLCLKFEWTWFFFLWLWKRGRKGNYAKLFLGPCNILEKNKFIKFQFSSVSSVAQSCLTLCDHMTCSSQASLSSTNSWSSLKLTSIELVMPSSHLILCRPLLLLPPIPPSIRIFSNESILHMRWPEYWNFSFNWTSNELSMNIQDWSPLGWTGWISLQSKGLSRVFSNTILQKHQFFGTQLSSQSNSHIHTWPLEKP